jgi:hypothetical protein
VLQEYLNDSGFPQFGTFSVGSNGTLTSTNTSSNMPTSALSSSDQAFSPNGALFALAGNLNPGSGIEIYNFNGASPLTLYKKLLTGTPVDRISLGQQQSPVRNLKPDKQVVCLHCDVYLGHSDGFLLDYLTREIGSRQPKLEFLLCAIEQRHRRLLARPKRHCLFSGAGKCDGRAQRTSSARQYLGYMVWALSDRDALTRSPIPRP